MSAARSGILTSAANVNAVSHVERRILVWCATSVQRSTLQGRFTRDLSAHAIDRRIKQRRNSTRVRRLASRRFLIRRALDRSREKRHRHNNPAPGEHSCVGDRVGRLFRLRIGQVLDEQVCDKSLPIGSRCVRASQKICRQIMCIRRTPHKESTHDLKPADSFSDRA